MENILDGDVNINCFLNSKDYSDELFWLHINRLQTEEELQELINQIKNKTFTSLSEYCDEAEELRELIRDNPLLEEV